jgi:hypothetical protein
MLKSLFQSLLLKPSKITKNEAKNAYQPGICWLYLGDFLHFKGLKINYYTPYPPAHFIPCPEASSLPFPKTGER